jgi:hypothetical protein
LGIETTVNFRSHRYILINWVNASFAITKKSECPGKNLNNVLRKVKIVGHKREFMSCGSIKPAVVILSIVLIGSVFLQVSYSQGPNVNSGNVNGTLEGTLEGGDAGMNASSSIASSTETTSSIDPKFEAARDQFLKVWGF